LKKASVVVKDTGGNPAQAVKAFDALSADDSLDAVLGPVAGSEIAALAPLANQKSVALLCPATSRDGLSAGGSYLFSNAMTNEMQGRAIARYAVEKLNLKKFAIMAPNDAYGGTLSDSFKRTVESLGGSVVDNETYFPNSTDFKKQLLNLGGQDPESGKD